LLHFKQRLATCRLGQAADALVGAMLCFTAGITPACAAQAANARATILQNGGGGDSGLLSGIDGPRSRVEVGDEEAQFRSVTGVRSTPDEVGRRGYVAGVGSLPLGEETTLRLNYIGDEDQGGTTRGFAGEARLLTRIDSLKLGVSETINHDFESPWTGYGTGRAISTTDAWADWQAFSGLSLGGGVRHMRSVEGDDSAEIGLQQSLDLGFCTLSNSTVTGTEEAAGTATGTFAYSQPLVGTYSLNAGLDYSSNAGLHPTAARLGTEGRLSRTWSAYANANQLLVESAVTQFDGGVRGEVYGLTTDAYAGVDTGGAGFIGVRLRLPLSPDPHQLGF
jgi:hypothetical protein